MVEMKGQWNPASKPRVERMMIPKNSPKTMVTTAMIVVALGSRWTVLSPAVIVRRL